MILSKKEQWSIHAISHVIHRVEAECMQIAISAWELLELVGNIGPVLYTICFNGAGTIPRVGLVISHRNAENLN